MLGSGPRTAELILHLATNLDTLNFREIWVCVLSTSGSEAPWIVGRRCGELGREACSHNRAQNLDLQFPTGPPPTFYIESVMNSAADNTCSVLCNFIAHCTAPRLIWAHSKLIFYLLEYLFAPASLKASCGNEWVECILFSCGENITVLDLSSWSNRSHRMRKPPGREEEMRGKECFLGGVVRNLQFWEGSTREKMIHGWKCMDP